MPSFVFGAVVVFLLANLAVGLLRLAWGPNAADRVLSVQLFGTTLVAVVLLLGRVWQEPWFDVLALVLAFLAAFPALSYNRRVPTRSEERHRDSL